MTPRPALLLLGLVVFLAWICMFVHAMHLEEHAAHHKEFMLDNTGAPVEVVWELGKGTRPATTEEIEDAKRED